MLYALKLRDLTAHINLYGYYPTFSYGEILTNFPFIDSVTVGEPEFTTLELAGYILLGKGIQEEINIQGLAVSDRSERVVFSPRPPVQDLDQIPYPDRHDIDLYQKKAL